MHTLNGAATFVAKITCSLDKFRLRRLPLLPSSGTHSFLSVLDVVVVDDDDNDDDDSNIEVIHIMLP
jgi:hypothetical protein